MTFRGDTKARIMIIGEAPGAEEDKLGVPFVGRAGKLLDEIFASVTLSTDRHCYVTNVVKRRPLNNRDPTAREIEWYRGYLREEIRLLDPAIIVCTGRHSMHAPGQGLRGNNQDLGRWFGATGASSCPCFTRATCCGTRRGPRVRQRR